MQANGRPQEHEEALAHDLERRIHERTQGRLHDVHVELAQDRLIVHGCTATYHAKQLALEAIGEAGDFPVELDIQVDSAPSRTQ